MAEPLQNLSDSSKLMHEALRLMQEALLNLDESQAPADIAARLDDAIQRLTITINGSPPPG